MPHSGAALFASYSFWDLQTKNWLKINNPFIYSLQKRQCLVTKLTTVWLLKGCFGKANVSCILRHRGVQLILAYSRARPVILAAGKCRGGIRISYVSSLSVIFLLLPCPSLSSHQLSLLSVSPFPLETTQNDPQGLTRC